jgi:hypothetical protein
MQNLTHKSERHSQAPYVCNRFNSQFDLFANYANLEADDFLIVILQGSNHLICILQNFIIDSNLEVGISYSREALDKLSFGRFNGVKEGIYVSSKVSKNDILLCAPNSKAVGK